MSELSAWSVSGVPEVVAGDDLAALLTGLDLVEGDVVAVTSKIVSKAEGRVVGGTRAEAVAAEAVRTVALRGGTRITENRLGLVMAASGVDASNVVPGTLLLLPHDPDATARALREQVYAASARNVAVLITDTAGRAWRLGQTDIAIGAAGLEPLDSHAGRVDSHGNPLAVTAPAVADELAGLAELVSGKLSGEPIVVIRGLASRVLPPGSPGPGARALVRARRHDLFALGAREAVIAALAGSDPDCFGAPASTTEVLRALGVAGLEAREHADGVEVSGDPVAHERGRLVFHAHGWLSTTAEGRTLGSPAAP